MTRKNHLLVIAIDEYHHFTKLNNTIRDAKEITKVLSQLYQFEEGNIHTLYNEEATEDGIDEKFLELVESLGEEDNLVVLYSGHGHYRENVNEGYWIPVDGRQDKVSDYISNANLIRYVQNIKAHHLLIIVDSCFSGTLVEQLRAQTDINSEGFPSRRVFASGRTTVVADDVPGKNSPFAKGIIDFLKNNRQKEVSTTTLIESVRTYVGNYSTQIPVEGRLRSPRDNRGEFFFRRKLTESDFWTNALAQDSFKAIEEYLEIYPEGDYAKEAHLNLRKQIAKKAWALALKSNTPDDYESFIESYSDSEFAETARAKLKILIHAEEEREVFFKEKKQKEIEVERCKRDYCKLAEEGLAAMRRDNYRTAREKFWECEAFHIKGLDGFDPALEVIQNKRNQCTKRIRFTDYKSEGKTAFRIRDYQSAIALFTKALEIDGEDEECLKLKNAATRLKELDLSMEITLMKRGNLAKKVPENPKTSLKPSIQVEPKSSPSEKSIEVHREIKEDGKIILNKKKLTIKNSSNEKKEQAGKKANIKITKTSTDQIKVSKRSKKDIRDEISINPKPK